MTRPNFCFRKIGHAALVQAKAPCKWTSVIWSHSLSDMPLKLIEGRRGPSSTPSGYSDEAERRTYLLSRRMPALLMRMVTVPKLSTAVLMTASPSVTDEVLMTALPPAGCVFEQGLFTQEATPEHTADDFIDDLLGSCTIEVVDDDVGSSRGEQERISVVAGMMSALVKEHYRRCTYAFPRPPPAPVTTTV